MGRDGGEYGEGPMIDDRWGGSPATEGRSVGESAGRDARRIQSAAGIAGPRPVRKLPGSPARAIARRLASLAAFGAMLAMSAAAFGQVAPRADFGLTQTDRPSAVMAGVTFVPHNALDPTPSPVLPLTRSFASAAAQARTDQVRPRSVGRALFQTTIVNVFYEIANLARGQVTAKITPETWWANMKQGWVWDLDDFVVNQVGHPYQGNNYFNAGRANGLSFWESAAVTAFGSGTWEYFGETNHASLNDLINTTLGGISLGEMFHRTAWLVRNTHATGRGRLWKEIARHRHRSGHRRQPLHLAATARESRTSRPTWCRRPCRDMASMGRRALARRQHPRRERGRRAFLENESSSTAMRRPAAVARRTTPSTSDSASAAAARSARRACAAGCSASR